MDGIRSKAMGRQMHADSEIVQGGGWIVRQVVGKPKTRLFGYLAVVWLFVAVSASVPFWDGLPNIFSLADWLSVVLIAVEPILVAVAVVFWIVEPARLFTQFHDNPEYDQRNLY